MKIYAVEVSGGEWEDSYDYEVMHSTKKSQVEYICKMMQSKRPEETCRVVEHELHDSFTRMLALKNVRPARYNFMTPQQMVWIDALCWCEQDG